METFSEASTWISSRSRYDHFDTSPYCSFYSIAKKAGPVNRFLLRAGWAGAQKCRCGVWAAAAFHLAFLFSGLRSDSAAGTVGAVLLRLQPVVALGQGRLMIGHHPQGADAQAQRAHKVPADEAQVQHEQIALVAVGQGSAGIQALLPGCTPGARP